MERSDTIPTFRELHHQEDHPMKSTLFKIILATSIASSAAHATPVVSAASGTMATVIALLVTSANVPAHAAFDQSGLPALSLDQTELTEPERRSLRRFLRGTTQLTRIAIDDAMGAE